MSGGGGEDGFLNRWSRRKLAEPAEDPASADAAPIAEAEPPEPERSDAEILEELGLPDPDTLGEGDDFSRFMGGAIPTRLRNRALRRLWLTNPVLANLDELVDYGEDFTDAATVVENLQTAWQVGKGFLKDPVDPVESDSPETPDAPGEEVPEADAGVPPDEKDLDLEAPRDAPVVAEAPEPQSGIAMSEPDPAQAAPPPRRMRFRTSPS